MLGSVESIKLVIYDGKVIGTTLGNVDVITLGIDFVTQLGYLDGYFDSSNVGKLQDLFIRGSLGYMDRKVLDSYEGIKPGCTDSYLEVYTQSHLGLMLKQSLDLQMDPLMVLILSRFWTYLSGSRLKLLMEQFLALMKA